MYNTEHLAIQAKANWDFTDSTSAHKALSEDTLIAEDPTGFVLNVVQETLEASVIL